MYRFIVNANQRILSRVGLEIPKVEVRYENLTISTNVKVGSRALPTLLNYGYDVIEVRNAKFNLMIVATFYDM